MSWYTPTPELTEPDRERGLKFMFYDGLYSHAMALLVTGAFAGCSWGSWIKDIVPEKTMGSYIANRLAAATALGAVLSVAAGFSIDGLTKLMGEASNAYGVIFLVAAAFGILGAFLLMKVPEPQVPARDPDAKWLNTLITPVKDPNFRRLLVFSSAWSFTVMPERYELTIPLLVLIHIIGGVSTAGFNLCAANIALKLAPHGKATAYLGTNAFCSGLSAAIAPIIGGIIGSYFAIKEISIKLFYHADSADPGNAISIPAMSLRGIDFIFLAAALVGFYALHRLSLIQEEGSVSESAVRDELFSSVRNSLVNTSGLSMGMRRMTAFPYDMLRKTGKSTSSTLYRAARTSVKHAKRSIRKPRTHPLPPKDVD